MGGLYLLRRAPGPDLRLHLDFLARTLRRRAYQFPQRRLPVRRLLVFPMFPWRSARHLHQELQYWRFRSLMCRKSHQSRRPDDLPCGRAPSQLSDCRSFLRNIRKLLAHKWQQRMSWFS